MGYQTYSFGSVRVKLNRKLSDHLVCLVIELVSNTSRLSLMFQKDNSAQMKPSTVDSGYLEVFGTIV